MDHWLCLYFTVWEFTSVYFHCCRQRQVCLGDFETWSNDAQSNKCFCCSLLRGIFWKQGSLRALCFAVGGPGLDERALNSNMAEGWILDPGVSPSEPCAIALPRQPDRDLPAMVSRLDHTLALIMCFNIEEGKFNGKLYSEWSHNVFSELKSGYMLRVNIILRVFFCSILCIVWLYARLWSNNLSAL